MNKIEFTGLTNFRARVNHKDVNHNQHIMDCKHSDPNNERKCDYRSFSKLEAINYNASNNNEALEGFICLGKSVSSKRRKEIGYSVIHNLPTEIQAALRALPVKEQISFQTVYYAEAKQQIEKICPRAVTLLAAHDDKVRWHIEAMILKYNPVDGKKHEWAKGLRRDGPGSTSMAEKIDEKLRYKYNGVNSVFSRDMADFGRSLVKHFYQKMTNKEQEDYQEKIHEVRMQLESNISTVAKNKRKRKKERDQAVQLRKALAKKWKEAPPVDLAITDKKFIYQKHGAIDEGGAPVVDQEALEKSKKLKIGYFAALLILGHEKFLRRKNIECKQQNAERAALITAPKKTHTVKVKTALNADLRKLRGIRRRNRHRR